MANYTWVGTDSSDWNDPDNWLVGGKTPKNPPGLNDKVTITANSAPVTVTEAGGVQSASLVLKANTGESIDLSATSGSFATGALRLTGLLNLQGTLSDSGSATFASGAEIVGGTTSVSGTTKLGATFTLDGILTTTTLSDSKGTSFDLGTGTLDVTSSTPLAPVTLAPLTVSGDGNLVGAYSTKSLTVLGRATLNLDAGNSLTATSATFDSSGQVSSTDGTLHVKGNASLGSNLTVSGSGTFTVDGTVTTDGGSISASDSSRVLIGKLNGSGGDISLSADTTSVIEIGKQNDAATGTITIDSGVHVVASGSFDAPGIVVEGKLEVASGQALSLYGYGRGLTGDGSVQIDTGALLVVNGVDPGTSDKVTIDFSGAGGNLSLTSGDLNSSGVFVPTIKGFSSTEVIDFTGDTITSAHYASGVLDLYDGSAVVAFLTIGAGYSDQFSVVPLNGGSNWQIDYLPSMPKAAPKGTATQDSYQWNGPVAGAWNNKASWTDTSHPSTHVAPGANDVITIGAAANGAAQVIIGDGNAYGLTLQGETLLDGVFGVVGTGALGGLNVANYAPVYLYAGSSLAVAGDATFGSYASVTLNGGTMSVTGTLYSGYDYLQYSQYTNVIENGGSLTVGALVGSYRSHFDIGAGSTLTVNGNVSDASSSDHYSIDGAGAAFTVGGTFVSSNDFIAASNGAQVQLAELTEDVHGSGIYLYADSSSSIEIGTSGNAAAGTITIDAGVTVTEAYSFSASTIIDNGTLNVGVGEDLSINGALVINGSVSIGAGGELDESGAMTLNGNVSIGAGGLLYQYGAMTGTGTVTIGTGATLSISQDGSGSAVPISFAGQGGLLALDTSDLNQFGVFAPTIAGFGSTDVIDFYDNYDTITGAHYANGVLDLYAGSSVVAVLTIGAGYSDQFSVVPLNGGSNWQIDYLGGGTNAAPAGTTTQDSYQWNGPVAGAWNDTANWIDTTQGQSPAQMAPGANDVITIGAAANGAAQVIIGDGNAYGLTLQGETLLDGVFGVVGTGALGGLNVANYAPVYLYAGSSLAVAGDATFGSYASVTLNGGTMSVTGTLYSGYDYLQYSQYTNVIENGGSLTVGALVGSYRSHFDIGAGSTLTVNGNVSDASSSDHYSIDGAGAAFTVGGTFVSSNDFIAASNGAQVQLAELTEDVHGSGIYLYADSSSSIEIGTSGNAAAGTITIDAGVTVTEAYSFSASTIIDNGTLNVGVGEDLSINGALVINGSVSIGAGGELDESGAMTLNGNVSIGAGGLLYQYGAMTGTGTVTIGTGATLSISQDGSGSAVPISFAGQGGLLALDTSDLNQFGVFAPTIAGFGSTDVIDFYDNYDTITGAHYANGVLDLYAGSSVVAVLTIGAGYSDQFSVVPLNGGSNWQIDYLGGGTNAAPAGTTTQDSYQWNGPVAGAWNDTANWIDTTQGQSPAQMAPGANDVITIGAAANGAAQVIIGDGNAYGLTLQGETLLDGVFGVVGTGALGGLNVANYAPVYLYAGSSLAVAGDATFGSYASVTLNGGTMSVTGTLYSGYDYLQYSQYTNVIENGGSLTVGALVGSYRSHFDIGAGSTLTVNGNVSDASSSDHYSIDGAGAAFTVGGTFVSSNDFIAASNGAQVQLAELTEDVHGSGIYLYADSSSSIEIGTSGNAAAGTITIDAGVTVTEAYSFSASTIIDNGTLNVGVGEDLSINGALVINGSVSIGAGGELDESGAMTLNGNVSIGAGGLLYQYGAMTGTGTVTIGTGATLSISQDGSGSAVPISFAGQGGLLALDTSDLNQFGVFAPTIAGFGSTDVIDFYDNYDTITGAHYANGVLDLYAGSSVVAVLTIGAGYSDQFSVVPLNGGSNWQIDYLGGGTNAAPAGTTTQDSYQWNGPVAGAWNDTANWIDTTQGQSPAQMAPGANDVITIGAAANGAAQVIIGDGNAYGLTLQGETLLDGVFGVVGTGALGGLNVANYAPVYLYAGSSLAVAGDATFGSYASVTLNGGTMSVTGTLYSGYDYLQYSQYTNVIENGGSLTVGALVGSYRSHFDIGAGSTLTVNGNVSDASSSDHYSIDGAGAAFTVGGTFVSSNDFIAASNGAQVQLAELTEDVHGSGIYLYADSSSSIEIGTSGNAAAGTITIDAGVTVTEAYSFSASTIIDNGTLIAAPNEYLTLSGNIAGSGMLSVGANSTLDLESASVSATDTIDFVGSNGTLYVSNPTGFSSTIHGFASDAAVDLSGDWSFVSFNENPAGTVGTLTLTNGANQIALNFAGEFTQNSFNINSGNTTIITDTGENDQFVFTSQTQSSIANNNIETIANFDFGYGHDQIALWLPVTGIDAAVTASDLSGLGSAFGANLNPGHAALAEIGSQVYLVVDTDGKVGYHGDDLMVLLAGAHNLSSFSTSDFIVGG